MTDRGNQFQFLTAAEAHQQASLLLGAEYSGENTPTGETASNTDTHVMKKNAASGHKNRQNVGSRPVSALQESMISDAWSGEGFSGGTSDRQVPEQRRGPKPSIDPTKANKAEIRDIGAAMERGDWQPEVNVYNDPGRAREAGQSSSVYDSDKKVVPAKGTPRIRRNQFGGVSMRTLAGNPALRRQLRLGAGGQSGTTSAFDVLDDHMANTGQQKDPVHVPVSQAKPSAEPPKRVSVFEHVEKNGVTDPVEVVSTPNGISIPNPLHRMRVAAAYFHDPDQIIPIKHINGDNS